MYGHQSGINSLNMAPQILQCCTVFYNVLSINIAIAHIKSLFISQVILIPTLYFAVVLQMVHLAMCTPLASAMQMFAKCFTAQAPFHIGNRLKNRSFIGIISTQTYMTQTNRRFIILTWAHIRTTILHILYHLLFWFLFFISD